MYKFKIYFNNLFSIFKGLEVTDLGISKEGHRAATRRRRMPANVQPP